MRLSSILSTLAVCAIVLRSAQAADTYPTSYPYEKEGSDYAPPDLPVTSPDEAKAVADKTYGVGGYLRRNFDCDPYSAKRLSLTEKYTGFSVDDGASWTAGFFECRASVYGSIVKGNLKFAGTQNCTRRARVATWNSASETVTGKVGNQEICKMGSCCKMNDGKMSPFKNWDGDSKSLTTRTENAGCKPMHTSIANALYCHYIFMGHNCVEYFPKGKSNFRYTPKPCANVMFAWVNTCALMTTKASVVDEFTLGGSEPQAYLDSLSVLQLKLIAQAFRFPDRVCQPYSYYVPSSAKGDKGTSDPGTPGTTSLALQSPWAFAALVPVVGLVL